MRVVMCIHPLTTRAQISRTKRATEPLALDVHRTTVANDLVVGKVVQVLWKVLAMSADLEDIQERRTFERRLVRNLTDRPSGVLVSDKAT